MELRLVQEGEYFYRIAEPEKALCDKLYIMSPVSNTKELATLLFEDLRMDEEELLKLDREKFAMLSERYHSTNVKKMVTLLGRMQK